MRQKAFTSFSDHPDVGSDVTHNSTGKKNSTQATLSTPMGHISFAFLGIERVSGDMLVDDALILMRRHPEQTQTFRSQLINVKAFCGFQKI